MNRPPTLKVLIASNHADIRVAISWMLRQSFPDAITSKAETAAEAAQLASAEPVTCVITDACLPNFDTELPGLSESLQRLNAPLIVIHDGQKQPQTDADTCDGISACLDRASINVTSLQLAISKAVDQVETLRKIGELEHELTVAKEQLEANVAIVVPPRAAPVIAEANSGADALHQRVESPNSQTAETLAASSLARPTLVTSGLEVSSDDERELAARVQHDLMPPGSPLIEGFDIAGLSIHAETTGGDYYDYLPMADDLLCISIGECSGRGLAPRCTWHLCELICESLRLRQRTSLTSSVGRIRSSRKTLAMKNSSSR